VSHGRKGEEFSWVLKDKRDFCDIARPIFKIIPESDKTIGWFNDDGIVLQVGKSTRRLAVHSTPPPSSD